MHPIANGTKLALAITATTAFMTSAPTTAYAFHEGDFRPVSTLQATTLDLRTPLNATVYHQFLDAKLDAVEAAANALRTKVLAIPAGTVLTGDARWAAKAKLAKVAGLAGILNALPDSGAFAPTATEAAQIARIEATLATIAARLKTLLANAPAVTPKVLGTRLFGKDPSVLGSFRFRHHCDGMRWDGWRFHDFRDRH